MLVIVRVKLLDACLLEMTTQILSNKFDNNIFYLLILNSEMELNNFYRLGDYIIRILLNFLFEHWLSSKQDKNNFLVVEDK